MTAAPTPSSRRRIHRQPALLPGGRPLPPALVYLAVAAAYAGCTSLAFTTYGLYVVRGADLTPLQLVVAGVVLEASAFAWEIPTGVVADVYSRRLSIIAGVFVTAASLIVMGAVPAFWFVIAGQLLLGLGATFLSGANQAWIADEVGEAEAAPLFLRAGQVRQAAALVGVPLAVGAATLDLQLPMLLGGALLFVLALGLLFTMSERGFVPALEGERSTWGSMAATTRLGLGQIRSRPTLVVLIAVVAVTAGAGEGLARLFPLYALEVIGLPQGGAFSEAVWFGIFAVGGLAGGIGMTELAKRTTNLDRVSAIARTLVLLGAVTVAALAVFALAEAFWLMLAGYWLATWATSASEPLKTVWINRGLDPRSRATVLSLVQQADPLGQVAGGPAFGLVASLRSVRAAMVAVALAYLPLLPLYWLGLRRERPPEAPTAAIAEADA